MEWIEIVAIVDLVLHLYDSIFQFPIIFAISINK